VQLGEHALAVLVLAERVVAPERGILDQLARLAARVGPGAEQEVFHALDIDARGVVFGLLRSADGGVDHGVPLREK
jgi:hypothetical protein